MKRTTVAVIGFLVAPLVPAAMIALRTSLLPADDVVGRMQLAGVTYFPALLFTVALGVPTFLLLLRMRLIRWWSAVGTGLALGAVVGLSLASRIQIPEVLFAAACGGGAALAFWMIWTHGSRTATA